MLIPTEIPKDINRISIAVNESFSVLILESEINLFRAV